MPQFWTFLFLDLEKFQSVFEPALSLSGVIFSDDLGLCLEVLQFESVGEHDRDREPRSHRHIVGTMHQETALAAIDGNSTMCSLNPAEMIFNGQVQIGTSMSSSLLDIEKTWPHGSIVPIFPMDQRMTKLTHPL